MKRREFLKGLLGAAVVANLPAEWLAGETIPETSQLVYFHPEGFEVNDLVHVPRTGETMIVTQIKDGVMNVTRSLSQKTGTIDDEEIVWILGNAAQETPSPGHIEGLDAEGHWVKEELLPVVDVVSLKKGGPNG